MCCFMFHSCITTSEHQATKSAIHAKINNIGGETIQYSISDHFYYIGIYLWPPKSGHYSRENQYLRPILGEHCVLESVIAVQQKSPQVCERMSICWMPASDYCRWPLRDCHSSGKCEQIVKIDCNSQYVMCPWNRNPSGVFILNKYIRRLETKINKAEPQNVILSSNFT